MADVTILHNPNCSTSRHAMEVAQELGVAVDDRRYLHVAQRLDRAELEELLSKLEDPATDLVRRDAKFQKLGLTDEDVATPSQVIEVLLAHPELTQRPVLIKGEPKGAKLQGGLLEFIRREVVIECLPADIPEHIDVDVTDLMVGQGIRVRDVATNPKWRPVTEPETMLVHVTLAKAEESAAAAESAAGGSEPEVIKKGKKEEEEKADKKK